MSEDPNLQLRRLSRRGFLWAGAAVIGGYASYRFLDNAVKPNPYDVGWPFRRALETNEIVWSDLFRKSQSAPTYSAAERTTGRVNGMYGLGKDFDPSTWELRVENVQGSSEPKIVTLEEIKRMPRQEFTSLFCCIEGWNEIITWAGVRFSDFAAVYSPPTRSGLAPDAKHPEDFLRYVAMSTPDNSYFVGLDMQSAMHPQTLLCYEMNGQPLTLEHGAPLRLAIPTKYGVKNIKRIGTIRYSDVKPRDYWAEQGYDWFAGL